jgi:pimeloyl-ACP methyl ester carboxylesterase
MACNIPYPIKSIDNPTAPAIELWNEIITGLRNSRPDYVANALPGIFGVPAGVSVPKATLQNYERIIAQADGLGMERTNKILVERDFTPEVTRLGQQGQDGVKILVVHGDSDTGLPYEASAGVVKKLVPRAEMKIYEKASHGINVTHAEQFLNDILTFTASIDAEKST